MGKTQAEIQKAYRERKKLKEGVEYLDRETKRVMKYYTPVSDVSKKKANERRKRNRENVKRHRQKKKQEKEAAASATLPEEDDNREVGGSNIQESEVSSSTDDRACHSRLIVKLPSLESKKRSRKRISRSTSKSRRVIKKLEEENKNLERKYKKVSKRYERLSKKTTVDSSPSQASTSKDSPDNRRENMTPRKRALQEIRDEGLSPSKIPKILKEKVIVASVIAEEINEAYRENNQAGKAVVKDIVFGKHVQKYRLKKAISKSTAVSVNRVPKTSKNIRIQKATRNQKTMATIKKKVQEFLYRDDNSRVMPGKNDKAKKKDGSYVQRRVLNDTLSYLHMKYNTEATRKISLSTFCRMRPKEVSLTKFLSRNKCLCQKHQNMALMLKAMKNAGSSVPINPDEFGRNVQESSDRMEEYLSEIKEENVSLPQWKKVELPDGKKKTKIVEENLSKQEFVQKAQTQAADFIEHCDRVKAQYKAMGNLKDNLPDGHCLVQMDFAENFTCTSADEVQSAYWNGTAVTLHPVVIYFKKDDSLLHKNYVAVSDDLGHNIGLVYAIIKDIVTQVKQIVPNLSHIHYWTDSPSSQYRNKTAFYIISDHTSLFGIPASWNYFETGHGKGPCDGVGGTAKRAADMGIKQEKFVVQDANDFYLNVGSHHQSASYIFVSSSKAEEARGELAEINKNLVALKGTMKVHHVSAIERGKVRTSTTSCYCNICLRGEVHIGTIGNILKQRPEGAAVRAQPPENSLVPEGAAVRAQPPENSVVPEGAAVRAQPPENSVVSSTNDSPEHAETPSITSDEPEKDENRNQYEEGDWVVASYEQKLHVGKIQSVDTEDGEYEVSFLRVSGGRSTDHSTYKWPVPADVLDIPHAAIICKIKEPEKVGRSGRSFKLNVEDIAKL